MFEIFALFITFLGKIIFVLITLILIFFLTCKFRKHLNYYKQNPLATKKIFHNDKGLLLASFYTYYALRPFSQSVLDLLFSKRYQPVNIDIFENFIVINGKNISIIDKNKKITLKKLPLTSTTAGMYDLYKEKVTIPSLYNNYFDEIYVTDIIGDDINSKLLLTPPLASCLKTYLPYKEIIVEAPPPIPIK